MAALTGIYTMKFADGRTEDWDGRSLSGMIRDAVERGAVSVTDPRGNVHGEDELAAAGWDAKPADYNGAYDF